MNWILLRGLMRQTEHWGAFPTALAESKGAQRVLCLDLPGVGTESNKIFLPAISQAVEDLRSRFHHYEYHTMNEKWGILGISLGGMIAMEWAHKYPKDFERLVVINSSSRDLPPWSRLKFPSMGSILKIFSQKNPEKREKAIIEMVSNLKKHDPILLQKWAEIAKKNQFSKVSGVNQLLAASLFKLPSRIKTPMLVLTSRADRMVDWKCSKHIAEKYRAPLKIHPTAGHELTVDDPKWVLENILEWVEKLS